MMRVMSNFELRAVGNGPDYIEEMVAMAFDGTGAKRATHYWIGVAGPNGDLVLQLFWGKPEREATPFPFDQSPKHAAWMIREWLNSLPSEVYGPKPDCDGSAISDGWMIESESPRDFVILTATPRWRIVHK